MILILPYISTYINVPQNNHVIIIVVIDVQKLSLLSMMQILSFIKFCDQTVVYNILILLTTCVPLLVFDAYTLIWRVYL